MEDCNHWLLWCPRWASDRQFLLTKVEERLRNFASLTDDVQSAAITDLACKDHETAQLIYTECRVQDLADSAWLFLWTISMLYVITLDSASLGLYPSAFLHVCTLIIIIIQIIIHEPRTDSQQ